MSPQEQYKYMSWCIKNNIKVYAVTEYEYQLKLLEQKLSKSEIGKEVFKLEKDKLLAKLQKSSAMHIAVEKNNKLSIGEKIFYSIKKNLSDITVDEQIVFVYKYLYEKSNKV
jgi:hypothetical protein